MVNHKSIGPDLDWGSLPLVCIAESYYLLPRLGKKVSFRNSRILRLYALFNLLLRTNYSSKQWEKQPVSTISQLAEQSENFMMNEFLQDLLLSHKPTRSFLEVGCDTGLRLKAVKDIYPHTQIAGIEVNPHAVRLGNLDLCKAGDIDPIIECCDITKPNVTLTKSYSMVLSWAVLMYIHPLKIKATLQKLMSITEETLIIIEPSASRFPWNYLPARNQSFLHNYKSIFASLCHQDFKIEIKNFPAQIWAPKYGDAQIFILSKF